MWGCDSGHALAYLTGRIGDQSISLHAEGEKVVMMKGDGSREEVDLGATGPRQEDDTLLPEPLAPMGKPADHPATADAEESAPGSTDRSRRSAGERWS